MRGAEARITCANGSDLRLGLVDRTAIVDAGALNMRGAFGNIPCGEAFIAPLEGTAEGTLVVDGSIAAIGRLAEPVELTVRDGHLVEASGAEGARLMELLTEHGADGTNVAELGIGTNECAILTGNILEDEKILGTAHVAFGASAAIGGTVQVPVHLDCVVLRPTVEIDGADDRAGRRAGRLSGGCAPLLAVPNVSEGRDAARIDALERAFSAGVTLLDRHSDPDHDRTVFTLAGGPEALTAALRAVRPRRSARST